VITEVDTSTLNTLFVVDRNGEELLIPAQEAFIVEMDEKVRRMTLELPEGLLHLEGAGTDES
jgi:16S rRNA processing protein RimM